MYKYNGFISLFKEFKEEVLNISGSGSVQIDNGLDESNITCREDFFLSDNNSCLPLCDRFEEYSRVNTQTVIIIELLAQIAALLISFLTLTLSVYNRKNM